MITNATYREGVAYSPDGAMYVTFDPSTGQSATVITATTAFRAPNGDATTPGYGFTAATNTGMFRDANGAVAFTVAGTSRAGVDGTALFAGLAGSNFTFYARGASGGAIGIASTTALGWTASTDASAAQDAVIARATSNSLQFGSSGTIASATARTEINKAVTAFTDAAAKAVLTITIPNAAHSASLLVRVTGSLGAGGAIGANEATATNTYVISFTRTAGVNATAAISAAFGAAATAVAGAATVTCTAAMSAVAGGVGATNTFDVNVTITSSGGSSTNHTCLVYAQLMNANATGITIA